MAASFRESPRRAHPALAEAFLNARCAAIEYVDRNGATTSRQIEPHYLYLSLPVWYLLAWDRLRGAVRHFRVDRIKAVAPVAMTFRFTDPKPFVEEMELEIAAL